MDNNARMRDAMVKAGWHRERSGGSHGIWHCPCGDHMASVPDGSSKRGDHSKNANPVLRRVQQCQQEMLARVAAGQPAIPEKPTPPAPEVTVTPEPTTPPVDPQPTRHVLFDGVEVEVITAEPASGPHPRNREMTAHYTGVSKLLLADGREVYACDDCDQFVGFSVLSAASHRGSKHHRSTPYKPLTPEKTIRAVVAAVTAAREHGQGDGLRVAAEALNAAKIYTSRGKPWSRAAIQAVWQRYKDEYPVEVAVSKPAPRPTPPGQPVKVGDPFARETNLARVAPPQSAKATARTAWMAIVADMDLNDIAYMQAILAGRVDEINRKLQDANAQAKLDDVIRDKAARFDQLQKLMGTT